MIVNQDQFELIVEQDEDPDTSYMDQVGFEEERRNYLNGVIAAYSVYAEVILILNTGTEDNPFNIEHKVRSPGLHCVMISTYRSPCDTSYVQQVFKEESEILIDMLTEMGMGVHRSKS